MTQVLALQSVGRLALFPVAYDAMDLSEEVKRLELELPSLIDFLTERRERSLGVVECADVGRLVRDYKRVPDQSLLPDLKCLSSALRDPVKRPRNSNAHSHPSELEYLLVPEMVKHLELLVDYVPGFDQHGDVVHFFGELAHFKSTFELLQSMLSDQVPLAQLEHVEFDLFFEGLLRKPLR